MLRAGLPVPVVATFWPPIDQATHTHADRCRARFTVARERPSFAKGSGRGHLSPTHGGSPDAIAGAIRRRDSGLCRLFGVVADVSVVIVGGGQAGLSVSRELGELGVEHVVLEASQVASAWRRRWDSFTLVTPNWTLDLPGSPYGGDDPEGHVARDKIVAYLQKYAAQHAGPIREGVRVDSLEPGGPSQLRLETNDGPIDADSVVVCTGAYQKPHRPPLAAAFPSDVLVLDAAGYANPATLPDGKVLVIGSGQTGVQLAEELHRAGRQTFLACGRAPWVPGRLGDKDVVTWLKDTPFFDQPVGALTSPAARLGANVQASGARGGHDLHYRVLQNLGVQLVGRLAGVSGGKVQFADDLAASVAFGDARYNEIRNLLVKAFGDTLPEMPDPTPFHCDPSSRSTWWALPLWCSRPDSGPTTRVGSGSRSSTTWASRSWAMTFPPRCPGSTSAASTSCANASRPCCAASGRTLQSWWPQSPGSSPCDSVLARCPRNSEVRMAAPQSAHS